MSGVRSRSSRDKRSEGNTAAHMLRSRDGFEEGEVETKGMIFMSKDFIKELDEAESFADIFELVKHAVWKTVEEGRAGLELGLMELGMHRDGFVGGFYPVGSNIIVMNKTPLKTILENDEGMFKPYVFHILLHEYLHSLGYFDEETTKKLTYLISREMLGSTHIATRMSLGYIPKLLYPSRNWKLPDTEMELVPDFDRSSRTYIE